MVQVKIIKIYLIRKSVNFDVFAKSNYSDGEVESSLCKARES